MKTAIALLVWASLVASAQAAASGQELQQMVQQLQANPADDALRERIIKRAQTMKPAPAIPEEAERRMARGAAAIKGTKSVADYQNAAKEFEQAALAAPWYGDAYFNLGVVQDKAENYEAALQSLKLALLAAPNDKEIKALIYEVEYRNERENTPDGLQAGFLKKVRRSQQQYGELIRKLDGMVFSMTRNENGVQRKREMHFSISEVDEGGYRYLICEDPTLDKNSSLLAGSRYVLVTSDSKFSCGSYGNFRLSPDGSGLDSVYEDKVVMSYQAESGHAQAATAKKCLEGAVFARQSTFDYGTAEWAIYIASGIASYTYEVIQFASDSTVPAGVRGTWRQILMNSGYSGERMTMASGRVEGRQFEITRTTSTEMLPAGSLSCEVASDENSISCTGGLIDGKTFVFRRK